MQEERFEEIGENNKIENAIKKFDHIKENTTCKIELLIKIRDRYYTLDYYELKIEPEEEIRAIKNEEEYLEIQPYGHYIIVNDLDFSNAAWGKYLFGGGSNWEGILDFNGHTVTQDSKYASYLFSKIGANGIIENLVLDIKLNHEKEKSFYGLFSTNSGLVRNIQLNLIESKPLPNANIGLMGYWISEEGIVENFVINMQEPLYGSNYLQTICRYNRGTIRNGYVYGKNIEAVFPVGEGEERNIGLIAYYNYTAALIQNVYSLASVNVGNQENAKERPANIVVSNNSNARTENVYSVGIGNIKSFKNGPNVLDISNNKVKNSYYFCDEMFENTYNQKTSMLALRDVTFQNQMLNSMGQFNVDELVSQGYYPHVKMPEVMPRQEFIELPEIKDSDLADIVSTEVLEQYAEEVIIKCNIHNPSGETIKEIRVENLASEIISQEYKDGASQVIVRLSNPAKYVSKYSVMSITTEGALNVTYTRPFEKNERIINVELYRPINNVTDWKKIKQSPTENYMLMNDIDFINEGNDICITQTFNGKFNGNGYTLKNINITSNLFTYFYGELVDLNISNMTIKSTSARTGFIGYGNNALRIKNVHLNDVFIENANTSVQKVGSLIAETSGGMIQDCSAKNINIKINDNLTIVAGGLAGLYSAGNVENCFTYNVNIQIDNTNISEGIGGLVGNTSGKTTVQNCYSHGKIISAVPNVGGIVGWQKRSHLLNCYSTVNIECSVDFVGSIIGKEDHYQSEDKVQKNLAMGNLYSKKIVGNVGRVSGTTPVGENYAYEGQRINGIITEKEYDANLLSEEELKDISTYEKILEWQDGFDYSEVSQGILPKIYYKDSKKLLPHQPDITWGEEEEKITIVSIETQKAPTSISGRIVINNPNQYPITKVNIEDMDCEIIRQNSDSERSYINFKAVPKRYYDNYKITTIEYEENDFTKEKTVDVGIDAIFYKEIYTPEDWQEIEIGTYQNYRLMRDLDFSSIKNVKSSVTIGRLEAEGVKRTIKNITITNNDGGLIKSIQTNVKNIIFDGITITSDKSMSNFGIIGISIATYKDLEFRNIEIKAPKASNLGIIGNMQAGTMQNVILENIKVTGSSNTGGLVGYYITTMLDQVTATNINVSTTGNYVGSILGNQPGYDGTDCRITNINVDNANVTGASYVGGIYGQGKASNLTITNSNITGVSYVGGICGSGTAAYDSLSHNDLLSKNNIITGSGDRIGGIFGNLGYNGSNGAVRKREVDSCQVISTGENKNYIGGFAGYASSSASYVGVKNTRITSKASRVGGVTGYLGERKY